MLDQLNEQLINEGTEPIAFDHDCREGICGMCSLFINGRAHGPDSGVTTCQLHMRMFKDGDTIFVEPWRSRAFPVIKTKERQLIKQKYKTNNNPQKSPPKQRPAPPPYEH